MKTSELIKKLLELSGLSQTEMSKIIGKPTSRIYEWLNDQNSIRFETAINFCNLLSINPKLLFDMPESEMTDFQIANEIQRLTLILKSRLTPTRQSRNKITPDPHEAITEQNHA